jgi:phenylacetate-CoA ligase
MLYDTDGKLVSSFKITAMMMQYTDILQFQFIQNSLKEFTMEINTGGTFTKEAELLKEIKACLGDEAVITIDYVSEIPLLSSGKRKIITNMML